MSMNVLSLPNGKLDVAAPTIEVTDQEAEEIIRELDLVKLSPAGDAEEKKAGIDVRKQIRLGVFSETIGGVRLRGGALLISEQIALRHMQRLDEAAAKLSSPEELKNMSYPIGYLHGQIAKTTNKAKVIVEYVSPTGEAQARGSESWEPGTKVLPARVA